MKEVAALIGLIALIVAPIVAWTTHCVWWMKLIMNEQMDTIGEGVLAVLGTLCPPIGVIHGFILWF